MPTPKPRKSLSQRLFDLDSEAFPKLRAQAAGAAPRTRSPRRLGKRFRSLGDLNGRTLADIQAVCGLPNARTAMPGGGWFCQWSAVSAGGSYMVGLHFDDQGRFVSIGHESGR